MECGVTSQGCHGRLSTGPTPAQLCLQRLFPRELESRAGRWCLEAGRITGCVKAAQISHFHCVVGEWESPQILGPQGIAPGGRRGGGQRPKSACQSVLPGACICAGLGGGGSSTRFVLRWWGNVLWLVRGGRWSLCTEGLLLLAQGPLFSLRTQAFLCGTPSVVWELQHRALGGAGDATRTYCGG